MYEHKRQRNLCANLLKQTKIKYFNKLNVKDLTDNEQFLKTVKPFFMEKVKTSNNITLAENNKSVKEDGKICETFNTYFTNSFNLRVAQKHQ